MTDFLKSLDADVIARIKDLLAIAATVLGIAAALIGFWKFREELLKSRRDRQKETADAIEKARLKDKEDLRIADLNAWALRGIAGLQTLAWHMETRADIAKIGQAGLECSILCDQGRLYFQNVADDHGREKPPAYRGYRPKILDSLVAGVEASRLWTSPNLNEIGRVKIVQAIRDAERDFVSYAQMEVGRIRSAAAEASAAGQSSPLQRLIKAREDGSRRG